MARSRARVTIFSRRRLLRRGPAADAPRARVRADRRRRDRPARGGAAAHRAARSCTRAPSPPSSASPGWPAVAEEAIIARDVLLAEAAGARLHVCHVSTAGSVELIRWAKARGIRVTAEVTPHHLLLTDEAARGYDAALQGEPAAADGRRRRGSAGRARRRYDRRRRDRPRPAPGGGEAQRVVRPPRCGMVGLETAALGGAGGDGRDRPARLGGGGAGDVEHACGDRRASPTSRTARGRRAPPTSCCSTRRRAACSPSPTSPGRSTNSPYLGRTLPGRVVATCFRGVADRARRRAPRRGRGRRRRRVIPRSPSTISCSSSWLALVGMVVSLAPPRPAAARPRPPAGPPTADGAARAEADGLLPRHHVRRPPARPRRRRRPRLPRRRRT